MGNRNDAQEHARQVELARRGTSTSDYRNQEEQRRIAQRDRERQATESAWRHAASQQQWQAPARGRTPERGCFADGTPVLTESGWRAIETLQAGDYVLAPAPGTHTLTPRVILRRVAVPAARIWEIRPHGAPAIATTAHHLFHTRRGWQPVRKLRPWDELTAAGGGTIRVDAIVRTPRVARVSNLVVEGDFTYIAAGCAVHSLGRFRLVKALWYRGIEALRAAGWLATPHRLGVSS
jgi:hypothetical protein